MTATMYCVPDVPAGRLAIVPRPRGGDRLADEVRALRAAGVDVLVSLLPYAESVECCLNDLQQLCLQYGVEFVYYGIPDRGVPRSVVRFKNLVETLRARLTDGKTVAVHCRAGIGRSSLVAASTLVTMGVDVATAFARIAKARGCPVPDTAEQRAWVEQFARTVQTPAPAI
jgi:protein-tyrosine phosphatase